MCLHVSLSTFFILLFLASRAEDTELSLANSTSAGLVGVLHLFNMNMTTLVMCYSVFSNIDIMQMHRSSLEAAILGVFAKESLPEKVDMVLTPPPPQAIEGTFMWFLLSLIL